MNRPTTQDAYEAIREYFSRPGAVFAVEETPNEDSSVPPDNTCVYLGTDGQKCAFGCLIPEELYNPDFEKFSAGSLLEGGTRNRWDDSLDENIYVDATDLANHFGLVNRGFIVIAQDLHDSEALSEEPSIKRFIERLDSQAASFGLEVVS